MLRGVVGRTGAAMTGDLWRDDPDRDAAHQGFDIPNKYLVPVCAVIIFGGGWWLGWFDPLMRFLHDVTGWN